MAKAYYARDEKGRLKKRSFVNPIHAELWQKEMQERRDAFRGGRRVPLLSSITLGEYSHFWLKRLATKRTISTVDAYARALKLHVLRYFNDKELRDLDQEAFDLLLTHIQENHGLDNATRNRVRSILHRLFEEAIKDKVVVSNPISAIERKKENPKKVHVLWTQDDCVVYLNGARKWKWDFYVFAQLALNIGARKSEMLALQWKHVNWTGKVITIEQILEQSTGKIVQRTKSDGLKEELKTKYVGLTPALEAVLIEHLAQTQFNEPEDFILSLSKGKSITPAYATTMHKRLCERLELKRCRIHDLRHTMATLMLRELKDISAVSEQLGHSNLNTTKIYVHLNQDDAKERAQRFSIFKHKAEKSGRVYDTFSDTFKQKTPTQNKGKK